MRRLPVTILRCPLTRQPLREMEPDALAATNAKIAARQPILPDGTPVTEPLTAALVCADGSHAYRVDDGIAELLASRAILLGERPGAPDEAQFSGEKLAVQQFYDEFGWRRTDENIFGDTARFSDRRPISAGALDDAHQRVKEHLDSGGEYLLDVASGPVLDEYLGYASGFRCRVCVDLSVVALREASRRVGDAGAYIVGDITNLPFVDDSMDGVISLHTIYHVPRDEQARAFTEIARVLRPGRSGVVVYQWAAPSALRWRELTPVQRLVAFPFRVARRLFRAARRAWRRLAMGSSQVAGDPARRRLYAHSHTYRWFAQQSWPFSWTLFSWSMVTAEFRQRYIHEQLLGGQLLGAMRFIERRFPSLAGRVGRFPLIVIRKT